MFCGSRRRKKGTNTRTPQKNGLYCMGGRRGGATSQGWVGKGPQSTFASRKNWSTVAAGKNVVRDLVRIEAQLAHFLQCGSVVFHIDRVREQKFRPTLRSIDFDRNECGVRRESHYL